VPPKAGSAASHPRPGGCASSPPLHDSIEGPHRRDVWPVRLKIDPGSNTTGVAIITDADSNKPAKVLLSVRVAVRASGSFTIGNADGINAKYCKLLHRADGYGYAERPALPPRLKPGVLSAGGSDDDDKGLCSLCGFVAH
jgi:hypothetical protein